MQADSFSYGNLIMHFTKIGEVNSFCLYNSGIAKGLKGFVRALAIILAIVTPNYSLAQSEPIISDSTYGYIYYAPTDGKFIYDFAKIFSDDQLRDIENNLISFQNTTLIKLRVVIVKNTGTFSTQEYSTQLAKRWGLANYGSDESALLFITTESKSTKIITNSGLNSILPTLATKQKLWEIEESYFRRDLFQAGINEVILSLEKIKKGDYQVAEEEVAAPIYKSKPKKYNSKGIAASVFFVIIMFIFFLIFRKNLQPKRKKYKGNFGSSGTRKWGSFGGSDNEDRSWQDNSTF